MSKSDFDQVPVEVLCKIFSTMDLHTKTECRLVCFYWQQLIDRFFIIARITLSNETYDVVRKSTLPTDTLIVSSFTVNCSTSDADTVRRSKLSKDAKHLIFEAPTDELLDSLNGRYSSAAATNISRLLRLNRNIETLIFEEKSLRTIKSINLNNINLHKLTSLGIDLSYVGDPDVLREIAKLKLPALRAVQLTEYWSDAEQETGDGYLGMYTLLANNKSSLKCVTLVHPMRRPEIFNFQPLLPPYQLEKLKQDLSEIQLNSLYIYFVSVEGVSVFNLGFHLLSSQASLAKLQVAINSGGNFIDCLGQVNSAIQKNSSSLQYLSILSHERWGVYMNSGSALDPISQCSQLEILEVDHFFVASLPALPASLKNISISGYLISDGIFPKLDERLVNLEQLTYTDMSMYSSVAEDIEHFERIINLPKMSKIRLFKQFVTYSFQEFLNQQPGILWSETQAEVTFRHNYLPYYDIFIVRQQNTAS